MAPKPKTKEDLKNDPIEKKDKTELERKRIQEQYMDEYEQAKKDLKEEIADIEGDDIKDTMLKERRDFIRDYRAMHAGKPPDDLVDFYNRFNVETPLSPEEEEARRLQEEEEAKNKKKKKKEAKKEKKKKGKKKKGDDDSKGPNIAITGPSEVVQKFDEFHQDFNEVWGNKDESDNVQ